MLLYRDCRNRYLAVPRSLQFAATNGWSVCFEGRDVPEVICAAFVREHGGMLVRDA